MTDAELSAIEQAAKAATPGPWKRYGYNVFVSDLYQICSCLDVTSSTMSVDGMANAEYISAANPAAVLSLIAELRQVKAERDWLAGILAEHCNKQDPSVYEADGSYCHMCKAKCQHPFTECENVTPAMWLEKAR